MFTIDRTNQIRSTVTLISNSIFLSTIPTFCDPFDLLFTEDDIIDFYKSNEIISIRKEDLQQPSKEFVIELYMLILEKFDKSINIYQPDILACINGLNDHMEQTYLAINVFHCINYFVSSIGMNDMKMIDILEPKRDRTIRILHSLATFYVRYNDLNDSWFKYKEKYSNIYRERKELEKRNANLKRSIKDKSSPSTSSSVPSSSKSASSSSSNNKSNGSQKQDAKSIMTKNIDKSSNLWILDSGCTTHTTINDKDLIDPEFKKIQFETASGETVESEKIGDVIIKPKANQQLILKNVAFGKFNSNLISIRQLPLDYFQFI